MKLVRELSKLTAKFDPPKAVEKVLDRTGEVAKKVVDTTREVVDRVDDGFDAAVDRVEQFVHTAAEKTQYAFAGATDAIESAIGKIESAVSGRVVHGPLSPVPHDQLKLKADFRDLGALEGILAQGGFSPVSLGELPLDRTYQVGTDRGPDAVLPSTGMKEQTPTGFIFDEEDQQTRDWYPQAVTTSADADGVTGTVDGKKWVAVSWYSKTEPRSRITLVDHSQPDVPGSQRYRHVELMVPDAKTGKLAPLKSHVGGVTWVGDMLYVAQTGGGIRAFDVRQLLEVQDPSKVPEGTERYVLPQVGYYRVQAEPGDTSQAGEGSSPRFSGLSLDRTGETPALLSQEYDGENPGGRIIRWELDPTTGRLKENAEGVVQASDAWAVPMTRVAGVVRLEDGFRIATMGTPSNLFEATEGKEPRRVDGLAQGIQQFSYDWTSNQVWTLAEHPGRRAVFAFEP